MEEQNIEYVDRKDLMNFFNIDGFVFDFSTSDFNDFTAEKIGIALCEEYGISKGKSLERYVKEAPTKNVVKLLSDLMDYYEKSDLKDNPRYNGLLTSYPKAKMVLDKLKGLQVARVETEGLKEKFDSAYINSQIDLMVKMQDENPTEAIGKAKELIESCCKTILELEGCVIEKKWDIIRLVDETFKYFNIMPKDIPNEIKGAACIKAVLGNLKAIAQGITELRNLYGSGHGKSSSFTGLEPRHASLAVGSSMTLVRFLWDSYERYKRINNKG